MTDLQIPAGALDAYEEAGSYRHALKIAAPLIVATELRRLLRDVLPYSDDWRAALEARADELDGGAK